MRFKKTAGWHALLSLLVLLSVTGCATQPQEPLPPAVVEEAAIPPLSSTLKQQPLPTGGYWSRVTQWRNLWEQTLNSLLPKSED